MSEFRYTKDHEWTRLEGDVVVCGISHYAQEALGDVVYVELPSVRQTVRQGEQTAIVESSKAASEVYAPVTGEIMVVNDALSSNPSWVNEAPTGKGWMFKIKPADPAQFGALMDEATYLNYTKGRNE